MDKILERLKAFWEKVKEQWNKYTAKQKTIIVCVALGILIAIVLLVFILTRPTYVQLVKLEDEKTASSLVDALDGDGIAYQLETDNGSTIIKVNKSDYTDATLLIGKDGILSEGMTWETALTNDMSTTQDEKTQKATLALQTSLVAGLKQYEGVDDAIVYIDRPSDDGTLFSDKKETTVSVTLSLKQNASFSETQAKSVAYMMKNAVGNTTTDNIVILDTKGNMLFGGASEDGLGGTISDANEYKEKLRNQIGDNVSKLLLKYGYDDVQVGGENITFNMDKITDLVKEYTVADGQDQGYLSSDYHYSSTGNSGSGGTPGTTSNDEETDYMLEDSSTTNSETKLDKANYLPNELVRNIEYEVGAVKPDESSIALVVTQYKVITEQSLQDSGALDNISFEDYAEQNKAKTALTVGDNVVALVSSTTGIAQNNITISAFEQPIYQANEASSFQITNYLMIILAVLIIALLVFVVIKGTSSVEVTEVEPELSVEELLTSTKEEQNLEDIEFSDKSELRMLIEKFVDDNPEAVALLLRNWLNEDWG